MRRADRWIIRHVDLQVLRGQLVYVIGGNGAGKSTCAKVVLGLLEIDEGSIERAPSLAVGYVPQRLDARNISTARIPYPKNLYITLY